MVTSGIRRIAYAPLADLQLQNMFSALASGEGLGALSNKATKSDEPESCRSTRRKQQVTAVGNSPLWEVDAPSDDQTCYLGRFACCWEFRSGTL